MNLIELLQDQIVNHTYLKIEDQDVVRRICVHLGIGEDLAIISDHIRMQVELEGGTAYLVGKYASIVSRLRSSLSEYRAGRLVELGPRDDEGLKWTKASKDEFLLGTDAKYAIKLEVLEKADNLFSMLKSLYNIVFGRDRKLEQLAINYRREVEIDRRSG